MLHTVDLATLNVISDGFILIFFSPIMAYFTDSDSSLDLILTVDGNTFQMQRSHLVSEFQNFYLFHLQWNNEGLEHTGTRK